MCSMDSFCTCTYSLLRCGSEEFDNEVADHAANALRVSLVMFVSIGGELLNRKVEVKGWFVRCVFWL